MSKKYRSRIMAAIHETADAETAARKVHPDAKLVLDSGT